MDTRNINLDGTPTVLSEVAFDGTPIIAEVAKRDIHGDKFDETYIKIADLGGMLKTINGETLVGRGDLAVSGISGGESSSGSTVNDARVQELINNSLLSYNDVITRQLATKQPAVNASNMISSTYIYPVGDKLFVTPAEKAKWDAASGSSGSSLSDAYDDLPTANSTNAVKSSGIKAYVDQKFDSISKEVNVATHEYLYVNDEVVEPVNNVISLVAQGTYKLSGYLKGHIIIDCSAFAGVADSSTLTKTTLILDDLYVESDVDQAILYSGTMKSLVIELPEKSNNFLVYNAKTIPTVVNSNALLQSLNNLEIKGSGYLTLRSNGMTHGIKATEIEILGYPHITINAAYGCESGVFGHDGIHASDSLLINNGVFNIMNTNDAIGLGNNASLTVYAGNFLCLDHRVGQHSFDVGTGAGIIYKSEFLTLPNDVSLNNVTYFDKDEVAEGTAVVKIAGAQSPAVLGSNGKYTISDAEAEITLSGRITHPFYFPNGARKINVILNDAVVIVPDTDPVFEYMTDGSRLSIDSAEGTENYLYSECLGGAISSANNIEIGGKGVLYVHGAVAGSNVAIKGDGPKYFYVNSGDNIQGTAISFGAEFDTTTLPKNADNGKATQNVYINNRVHARISSNNAKAYIVYYANQAEDVFIGDVYYETAPSAVPASGIYDNTDGTLVHVGSTSVAGYDYEYVYVITDLVSTISKIEDSISDLESGATGGSLPTYPELQEGETAILSVTMKNGQYVLSWLKVTKQSSSGIQGVSIEDSEGNPINIVAYDDNGNLISGIVYGEN